MITGKNNLAAIAALLLLFALSSCTSPQKLVESGNYDQAVYAADKRLAGKKVKRVKFVLAVEEGFEKAP